MSKQITAGRQRKYFQNKSSHGQMTHIQVQNQRKCVDYIPQTYTSHIKHSVHDLFHVCNKLTMFKLHQTRTLKTKFAIDLFETP